MILPNRNLNDTMMTISSIKNYLEHPQLMMFCWNTARYFEQLIFFCAVPVQYSTFLEMIFIL